MRIQIPRMMILKCGWIRIVLSRLSRSGAVFDCGCWIGHSQRNNVVVETEADHRLSPLYTENPADNMTGADELLAADCGRQCSQVDAQMERRARQPRRSRVSSDAPPEQQSTTWHRLQFQPFVPHPKRRLSHAVWGVGLRAACACQVLVVVGVAARILLGQ